MIKTYLSSEQRVKMALEHREPDRIPFDIGSTSATGITAGAYKNLLSYMGVKKDIKIIDMMQQLAYLDEDFLEKFKVDTRGLSPNLPSGTREEDENYLYFTDSWGIKYRMPKKGGYYYDIWQSPLKGEIEKNDIDRYPWPDLINLTQVEELKEKIEQWKNKNNPPALVLEATGGGFFEYPFWLRGFENFYMDLVSNPSLACYLMDKILEYKMRCWEILLKAIGEYILVVWESNDLGVQNGTMISPEMYRKYVKPREKKLFTFIRKASPKKIYIAYHTCGSVYDIIPDLIEVGVDILNPVQVSAAKMDTKKLKKEFGKDLTFWGGGVDTQHILPYGTPRQVKEEVKRRIEDLAPGGGFVFTPVHNIQAGVPPENIIAMWETLQDYGRY